MQKLIIYLSILLFCAQCAQVTPLNGGKKDISPPKAISYSPENASLNFNAKQITIKFDEYIQLVDITNQFIITPQTKEMPEITLDNKTLKITFNELLLENATYKLSFGNAIVDLNEGNILQNFEYIFSTGSTIDSLKLTGQVLNAFDKRPVNKLLIGLYRASAKDSIIYKDKPLYISKTDEGGNFNFNYLPNAPFKLIAIDDVNKNLMYDGSEEQIAFQNDIVNPKDGISSNLLLFKETPSKSFIIKSLSIEYGKAMIVFNKPQLDIKSVDAPNLFSVYKNPNRDTLILYYNNQYDQFQPIISYHNKKADTVTIKILSRETLINIKKNNSLKYILSSNLSSDMPYYEMPQFDLNYPIDLKNISENKITLVEQKNNVPLKKTISVLKDLTGLNSFTIQSTFNPETNYTLTINQNALKDSIYGRSNDSIVYKFKTTSPDDYAKLNLKIFFPKKENYIVLLLNDKDQIIKKNIVEVSLNSTSEKLIEYKNIPPGIYFSRVIEDANKNGAFDVGDYFLHQQSETIFINTKAIKLLAGWEIENEWTVQ